MSNDTIIRSTPQEEVTGSRAALTVVISALIATHPDRRILKTILTKLAAENRRLVFDEADAVCFIRDAYDKQIGCYLSIIDGTDQALADIAARIAGNARQQTRMAPTQRNAWAMRLGTVANAEDTRAGQAQASAAGYRGGGGDGSGCGCGCGSSL